MIRALAMISIGAGILGLGACGAAAARYPEEPRNIFLSGCAQGAITMPMCECIIKKIEAKYSFEEFSKQSVAFAQTGTADQAFLAFGTAAEAQCTANPNS
jgi:hypothetical protein